MKKSIIALLIVIPILIAACAGYAWQYQDDYTLSPFKRDRSLSNVSKVKTDLLGNMYLISHAKEAVIKLDEDGVQQFRIRQGNVAKDGRLTNFDDVAVDEQGYVYVLLTKLNRHGLYVIGEEIVRYTPEGKFDKTLYEKRYSTEEQLHRIGKIKSLHVERGWLYFFETGTPRVNLKKMNVTQAGAQPLVHLQIELPGAKFVSELTGHEFGQIVYTTRSGEIYRVEDEKTHRQLYPTPVQDSGDRVQDDGRSVLMSPRLNGTGELYFIQGYTNELMKLHLAHPEKLETLSQFNVAEKGDYTGKLLSLDVTFNGTVTVAQPERVMRLSVDAEPLLVIEDYSLSWKTYAHRWLLWGIAFIAMLLLALELRLIYIHILKRKTSLILKKIVVIIPLFVFSIVFVTNTVLTQANKDLTLEVNRELQMLAHNGKKLIDGNRLQRLNRVSDYMNEDYQALQTIRNQLFTLARGFDREGLYSTIYKVENGNQLFKIFDDDDGTYMFEVIEMDEDFEHAVAGHTFANESRDENGYWLFAMSPIYNSAGDLVGIFEVGKDMHAYEIVQREMYYETIRQMLLVTGVCILIFVFAAYWLLSPLRKLRKGVIDFSRGKWEAEVHIRTGDEVADLGERFNEMADKIRRYIQHITSTNQVTFRFVPQAFLKYLGKESILDLRLGDQIERDMSILVSNIRNFYHLSKKMTPQENFKFLNSYLSRFGPVVRKHEGVVNKYLGGGIMALYPRHADTAIASAVEMRAKLDIYNQHRANMNYESVELGIALHKGPIMIGIIGEEERMDGSVISDVVMITEALEKMCVTLGAPILATENFMDSLTDRNVFDHRYLGIVTIPEHDQPIPLYDIYHGDDRQVYRLKHETKALFESAVTMFQQGRFFDAREAFVEVIRANRWDKAAKLYFSIADQLYRQGATEQWNGSLHVS